MKRTIRSEAVGFSTTPRTSRRAKLLRALRVVALTATAALCTVGNGCAPTEGMNIKLRGERVRLRLIHTSDIHSRLLPYQFTPLLPDRNAGLQLNKGPYGGIAKLAYVSRKLRSTADRSIHLDGGDIFQGAPIFNYFNGEAEIRSLSAMGIDAMIVANHEFDKGANTLWNALQQWATFPVLAANYRTDDPSLTGSSPLGTIFKPYTVLNVRGLRVAVIGMGNLSTVGSLYEQPNKLGLLPYSTREIAQFYIDLLRPQADMIVVITHLGLETDQRLIESTEGIDVVLGGHNHIVVWPPKEVYDCGGAKGVPSSVDLPSGSDGSEITKRKCTPRKVLLMHSGAFSKFIGSLDVDLSDDKQSVEDASGYPGTYEPKNGFEVISHKMDLTPIDRDVPEDRVVADLLEPYKRNLKDVGNLDLLVGYAPGEVKRAAPAGGDSSLGNLIATSMWLRLGVQTDFAFTNTTGIRADLPKGPITLEQMFNVFPFDNSIAKLQLSGSETFETFDFIARRSASRACRAQTQIAGAFAVFNCVGCDLRYRPDLSDTKEACAEQIYVGYTKQTCKADTECLSASLKDKPYLARFACDTTVGLCRSGVTKTGSYELATSTYLATGGSGFRVLQRNTTTFDTKIQQRDAATDFVRIGRPCGFQPAKDGRAAGLIDCAADADCAAFGDYVCACPANAESSVDASVSPLACRSKVGAVCTDGTYKTGKCVLKECRDDVASFHDDEECKSTVGDIRTSCRNNACLIAGEQCKILACVDAGVGAVVDGRQVMLGR